MKHSEWMQPAEDEVRELEYTQLEDGNGTSNSNSKGNGNGNGNPSVPVNGGIWVIVAIAMIYGYFKSKWKQSPTS